MTDNLDEFDSEGLEPRDSVAPSGGGFKNNLVEAWRTQPLFKLIVIMIVVGLAIAAALGVFSNPDKELPSVVGRAPGLKEPPGGAASPYFIEQNKQANIERAQQAEQEGGSALPTPVGQNIDLSDLTNKQQKDPLAEFRAETERLKTEINRERQQNAQQIEALRNQTPQPPPQQDDSLSQAMQRQMQQLMEAWAPTSMKQVNGEGLKEVEEEKQEQKTIAAKAESSGGEPTAASSNQALRGKNIIEAGTVNYAQLLTEANSDVPGPILAQVLSGPFAGGRAVGHFKTMYDYLVIEFNLINYKGKDYSVSVLALDPDTTLGGMATEVDHRYFDRVVLPAAAAFASEFGQALGQGGSSTTITNNAVVIDQASRGYEEALFAGMGSAGESVAEFFQQEASQTKPLIRVAVGTPMGLFFTNSVQENQEQWTSSGGYNPYALGNQEGVLGGTATAAGGAYAAQPYYNPAMGTAPVSNYSGSYAASPNYRVSPGAYSPAAGYAAPGVQQGSGGVTVIVPGQTGLGTGYYSR